MSDPARSIGRVKLSKSGVTNAAGTLLDQQTQQPGVTFPPTPMGSRWVVAPSIPRSPNFSTLTALVGGSGGSVAEPALSFGGPAPAGPLTLDGPETLTITGTNLTPNTPYNVTLLGKQGPVDLLDPIVPQAPPTGVNALAGPNPTTILSGAVTLTTTVTFVNLLASPGVGHAWRLFYAMLMAQDSTSQLGETVQFQLTGTGANIFTILAGTQAGGGTPSPEIPVPAGIVLPDNQGIYVIYSHLAAQCAVAYNLMYALDH